MRPDAAGSWEAFEDGRQRIIAHPPARQAAYTVVGVNLQGPQPAPVQPFGQAGFPLHIVLPHGSVSVLAANVVSNGHQGAWQPVLLVPAGASTAADSRHGPLQLQNGAAPSAALSVKRRLPATVGEAALQANMKCRRVMPAAGGDSNRAAARLLRGRLQERRVAADSARPASSGAERTAANTLQPMAVGAECNQQSIPQAQAGVDRAMQRQIGDVDATLAIAAAHERPTGAAEAVVEASGGPDDDVVPECLRRMAEARDDSEVVFLGTGCAEPSKHRGASGILLRCGSCSGPADAVSSAKWKRCMPQPGIARNLAALCCVRTAPSPPAETGSRTVSQFMYPIQAANCCMRHLCQAATHICSM